MATVISTQRWTAAQMRAQLPPESRYELRHHTLIDMSPAPKPRHQEIAKRLFRKIDNYVFNKKLGEAYFAPIDVVFGEGDVCQPDLVFVSNEQMEIVKENAIVGVPKLLVEVVSKGSVARDYIEKKEDYEAFGVAEYWIVDPRHEAILVYTLDNGKYRLFSSAEEEGSVQSKVLEGLTIASSEIFAL
ncbi:MAG: Uma2 family endonuclease [Runella sp.]